MEEGVSGVLEWVTGRPHREVEGQAGGLLPAPAATPGPPPPPPPRGEGRCAQHLLVPLQSKLHLPPDLLPKPSLSTHSQHLRRGCVGGGGV